MARSFPVQLSRHTALLRLRDDADIGLRRLPTLRITPLRFIVRDRTGDDHIFAWFPVDRRSDLVLRGQLQRVDHPQHFIEVPACCHRIDKEQLDLFVRADDVNVAYGCIIGRRAFFRVARDIGPTAFRTSSKP